MNASWVSVCGDIWSLWLHRQMKKKIKKDFIELVAEPTAVCFSCSVVVYCITEVNKYLRTPKCAFI